MERPDWVSDASVRKFDRAVLQLKKENKPVTEEAVKELYLKWGGLILGEPETRRGVDETTMTPPKVAEAEENLAKKPRAKKEVK